MEVARYESTSAIVVILIFLVSLAMFMGAGAAVAGVIDASPAMNELLQNLAGAVAYIVVGILLWAVWLKRPSIEDMMGRLAPDLRTAHALLGIPLVGLGLASLYIVYLPLSWIWP